VKGQTCDSVRRCHPRPGVGHLRSRDAGVDSRSPRDWPTPAQRGGPRGSRLSSLGDSLQAHRDGRSRFTVSAERLRLCTRLPTIFKMAALEPETRCFSSRVVERIESESRSRLSLPSHARAPNYPMNLREYLADSRPPFKGARFFWRFLRRLRAAALPRP
jgi:hypothetical protein